MWGDASPEERMRQAGGRTETHRPPPGQRFGRLRVLCVADLEQEPPRSYVVKGLMSPAEVSVWWGAPKCGKSFLLLHLAYAIAQARPVFDRRVIQTSVLYAAAEGEAGLAKRVRALRERYGDAAAFRLIAQPADLLHESGHLREMVAAARGVGAGLIVLDTLSRMIAGGDENSSQDMGQFVANVGELRAETGAHVAIVHHGTKQPNGASARGHSSLLGAADLIVEVSRDDVGGRTAAVRGAKDDADGVAFSFTLGVVQQGTDSDGDAITTCIVDEAGTATPPPACRPGSSRPARLTDDQTLMLRELISLAAGPDGESCRPVPGMPNVVAVRRDRFREQMRGAGWFIEAEISVVLPAGSSLTRAGYKRENKALNALKARGFIGFTREHVWPL